MTFYLFYYILNIIEIIINAANYNFILNNVKGMQASRKRLKPFEYLEQNINFNDFILFQETHSSLNDEKQWKDEFNSLLFFSNSKTNSCGVAAIFLEKILSIEFIKTMKMDEF